MTPSWTMAIDVGAVTALQGTLAHGWNQMTYGCAAQHDGSQGKIEPVALAIRPEALVECHRASAGVRRRKRSTKSVSVWISP